jgi:Ca2+-binding EF-hand superfamily protein
VTKRFDRVDETGRGKLLYNQVTAAIESMGRSISDQEKRQILIEILKDLC